MDAELVINEFLSDPRISFYLKQLKTNNWNNMKESEKKKFFLKFNDALCEYLDIIKFNIVFENVGEKREEMCNDEKYCNIKVAKIKRLIINDINYNQYLTLYEYLYRVREEIQNLAIFTNYGKNFDSEIKAKWSKAADEVRLGDIKVDMYIEEGEYLSEYQDIKLDAKEFAEKIMFKIVKDNFEYENSHDEQYFMNNRDILYNSLLVSAGNEMVANEVLVNEDMKNNVLRISEKINKYHSCDLSKMSDEDLYMVVYPYISVDIDAKILVKVYQEIINRIYDESINIGFKKNNVIINNNVYNSNYFSDNHFNIILYECLRKLDYDLRHNKEFINSKEVENKGLEEAIVSRKKRWVYNTVLMMDRKMNYSELSIFKYQPLFRLIDKENLGANMVNSKNGCIPLKKRRK